MNLIFLMARVLWSAVGSIRPAGRDGHSRENGAQGARCAPSPGFSLSRQRHSMFLFDRKPI
jgi:hypothetical protein